MYNYKAKVLNIVDGDTIDVKIDIGFALEQTHRLRLLGINTPELHDPDPVVRQRAQDAKTYLKGLIDGMDVIIYTEKDDDFGRYLAVVYYNNQNINDIMIRDGFAVPYKRRSHNA